VIFSSYEFIFAFLPIALGSFLLLSRLALFRLAMAGTILFSLFFYAWWNPPYVILIVVLMIFNYGVGKYMLLHQPGRKAALILGIGANLAVLAYFKYADFFIGSVNELGGSGIPLPHVILPLAISFFTFQKIAFLSDIYSGKISRLNFLDYCLFVLFFPQLIAGPIVHYRELKPQFDQLRVSGPAAENVAIGLAFFLIGLGKKVIIADSVARYSTPIFDLAAAGGGVSLAEAWLAALAYTCQLYFDFSGYSDMAIGLARMFSIRLPFNFDSPYKSLSIIEFWRRWHITLSVFLRDYLYIPLGGNRKGPGRRYVNLLMTMLLGGLWHGAGWTFVVWGGLHGVYLVTNHIWREAGFLQAWRGRLPYKAGSFLLTFLCVVVAWVVFRADGIHAASTMLHAMVAGDTNGGHALAPKFAIVAMVLGIALLAPNAQSIVEQNAWRVPRPAMFTMLGVMGAVALMLLKAPAEFIYFRF
jgi:D-alanyl-lipoteichoic acid acyltransferase DltB (MBOAT superfamily)